MNDTGSLSNIPTLMARRLRCTGCMRRFRAKDISTIESAPRFGVFILRCPMCLSERLIIVVWNKSAVRTYATDLDVQEWQYYRHKAPIDSDDVIRIARVMSEYDGDLSDVLEDPLFDERND